MGDVTDAVQLRILTHYAAGTELSSIAAMTRLDYDEVVDVVATVAGFDRSRASELIRRTDRSRPTAPTPARARRIEFKLPPVEEPTPPVRKVVQPEPSAQITVPADGGQETEASIVDSSARSDPVRPKLEVVPLAPTAPAAPDRIGWWDAFLCLACWGRSFLPNDCCGQPTLPVTLTMTLREVA